MPQVGKKHFGYGPKGRAAAKKEAKRTGKKVVRKKNPGYIVAHTTYKRFASVLFEDAKKKAEYAKDADALRKARQDNPNAPEWAKRLTQPRGETPVAKRKRLAAKAKKNESKKEAYTQFAHRIDELLPILAAPLAAAKAAGATALRVGAKVGAGVAKGAAKVGAGALRAGARAVKGVGNVVKKVGSGVVKRKVAGEVAREDEEVQEEGIGTKLGRTAVTAIAPGTALLNKTKTGRKVLGGIKTGARAAGMVPGVGVVGDVVAGSIASGQRVLEKDPKRKKVLNKEIAGDALAAIPVVGQGTRGTQMGTKAVRRIAAGTEMNYKNAYVRKLMEGETTGGDVRKTAERIGKALTSGGIKSKHPTGKARDDRISRVRGKIAAKHSGPGGERGQGSLNPEKRAARKADAAKRLLGTKVTQKQASQHSLLSPGGTHSELTARQAVEGPAGRQGGKARTTFKRHLVKGMKKGNKGEEKTRRVVGRQLSNLRGNLRGAANRWGGHKSP